MPSDEPKSQTRRSANEIFRLIAAEIRGKGDLTPKRWAQLAWQVRREETLMAVLGTCQRIKIGRFEAIQKRGAGGYGVVFEVWDPEFERHVALKLCAASGPKAAAGLKREAKILAKLSHPNVVRVYEPGQFNEDVFFVMELVDGMDGHDFARQEPRPSWEQVVDVYRQAGRGLAAAHAAQIIHGDFKPSNFIVDENGQPRVCDFGVAQVLREHDPQPRQPGSPVGYVGSLGYMPPESLRSGQGDARSDQWSFCAALWWTLEGCFPFTGLSGAELLMSALVEEPRVGDRQVPERVREVLRVGLSPRPEDRYATMEALLAELDRLLEPPEEPELASDPAPMEPDLELEPVTSKGPAGASEGRIPVFISGLLVGAIALGVLSYSHVPWPWDETQTQPPPQAAELVDHVDDPPCLDEGAPFETDAAVLSVCLTLKVQGYEQAALLWDELYAAREQTAKTRSDLLKLACSNAVVARTFLHEANELGGDLDIRKRAKAFALVAVGNLNDANEVETVDSSPTVSQIQKLLIGVTDANDSDP